VGSDEAAVTHRLAGKLVLNIEDQYIFAENLADELPIGVPKPSARLTPWMAHSMRSRTQIKMAQSSTGI
jgi:hypothetical protein